MLDAECADASLLDTDSRSEPTSSEAAYAAFEVDEPASREPKRRTQKPWWARAPVLHIEDPGAPDALSDTATAAAALRLLVVVLVAVPATRWLVCDRLRMECDPNTNVYTLIHYDMHKVVLDMAFLFVVGRLGPRSPLEAGSAGFLLALVLGALAPSLLGMLPFMKVSLSAYAIRCTWKAMTFATVALILVLVVVIVVCHLRHFVYLPRRERLQFAYELVFIVIVFVAPRVSDPAFHAHHWFTFWLLALLCRFQTVWSRATQAFLLGIYVNGLAAFGRDPVLGCHVAWRLATDMHCGWFRRMQRLIMQLPQGNYTEHSHETVYAAPDPWGCSQGDYS